MNIKLTEEQEWEIYCKIHDKMLLLMKAINEDIVSPYQQVVEIQMDKLVDEKWVREQLIPILERIQAEDEKEARGPNPREVYKD